MSKVICLDAGHGYFSVGKRIPGGGEHEWSLNNAVCNYAETMLKEYNDVIVERTDDRTGNTDVALNQRLSKAKSLNPIVLISVHHNAAGNGSQFYSATGVSTYVREGARSDSKSISTTLVEKMSSYTGLRNRGGAIEGQLYMTTICNFPTLIAEGGFMDGESDSKIIVTEVYQKAYAKAIVDTLVEFFGLIKSSSPTTVVEVTPTTNNSGTDSVYAQVTNCTVLNVRSGPGTNFSIIRTLTNGNEVDVLESYTNGWSKINIVGQIGYVNHNYLTAHKSTLVTYNSGTYQKWTARVKKATKVRTAPGTWNDQLAAWPTLGVGNLVDVIGEEFDRDGDLWYKVDIQGNIGYVYCKYLV